MRYIGSVEQSTVTPEALWNRDFGPEGSTRHLHQFYVYTGVKQVWRDLVKAGAVFGEIPPLSVQIQIDANDNELAPVALAA